MAEFVWVWSDIGVNSDAGPFRSPSIIPVPLHRATLVVLRGASDVKLQPTRGGVEATEVECTRLLAVVHRYVGLDLMSADDQKDLLNRIYPTLRNGPVCDDWPRDKLFEVKGKLPGKTTLQAGKVTQNVEVLNPTKYTVSFKFVQPPENPTGDLLKNSLWTTHNASEVNGWISKLNWIFGSQTNITFQLGKSEPLRFKPYKRNYMQLDKDLDEFNGYRDSAANFTVFLCGDQLDIRTDSRNGSPPATTWQPDDGLSWVIIMRDHPQRAGDVTADEFSLSLAHELSHAIQLDHRDTHYDEDLTLRSNKRQTAMIGNVLWPMLVLPVPDGLPAGGGVRMAR